jgi:tetratricopeptide (TPR) repeat protein
LVENLPLVQTFRILRPHLNETNDSVIMEIARVLSEIPLAQIPPADASVLTSIFKRYLNIQSDHLDLPSVQVQLGNFYSKRGYPERAESAYRAAIRINPQVTGASSILPI